MKHLGLVLLTVPLALTLAACGGGAQSAGPAPSVPTATAPPATTPEIEAPAEQSAEPASTAPATPEAADQTFEEAAAARLAEDVAHVTRAEAICRAATEKLEAALRAGALDEEELAFRLSYEALVKLRALPPPGGEAVNPVPLCSHHGWAQGNAKASSREQFIHQARAACSGGLTELRTVDGVLAAAAVEEKILAELRALPQPEADRALLEEFFYSVIEQEIAVMRESAAAMSAGLGDTADSLLLGMERVHLTHQRDAFAEAYGLGPCPQRLPA